MSPSRRQLDALDTCLRARDGAIKEAAHDFGVSYAAMRSILHRLYRSIDVTTQAQAVAWADRNVPGWREDALRE